MYQVKAWSVTDNGWKIVGVYHRLCLARMVQTAVAATGDCDPYIVKDGCIIPDNAE